MIIYSNGISRNMFSGISKEMMDDVLQGKSPLCAIERRINNGKTQAFNIGRAFGLIPSQAYPDQFMNDSNPYYNQ